MREEDITPELQTIQRAVYWDFNAWERRHRTAAQQRGVGTPSPDVDAGLPEGWTLVAHLFRYGYDDTSLWLTRRTGGGWVILRRESDLQRTRLLWVDLTLGDLYRHVGEEMTVEPRRRAFVAAGIEETHAWLRDVLTSLFDDTNPVEAGEKMIFALSGSLTTEPAAAR